MLPYLYYYLEYYQEYKYKEGVYVTAERFWLQIPPLPVQPEGIPEPDSTTTL